MMSLILPGHSASQEQRNKKMRRAMALCWWRAVGLLILLAMTRHTAAAQSASEYQVKAAFLYNFAKFVEWPPSGFRDATAPLQICILGRDPFGQGLRDLVNTKTVNGRKLEVDYMVDMQLARACHILFIASSEKARVKQILESMRGTIALTVGDTEGFAEQGGMINFLLDNDRVLFEVNRNAAEQAGLRISSKLLSVAKAVIG
jgi:YfiR/HmsC-like